MSTLRELINTHSGDPYTLVGLRLISPTNEGHLIPTDGIVSTSHRELYPLGTHTWISTSYNGSPLSYMGLNYL